MENPFTLNIILIVLLLSHSVLGFIAFFVAAPGMLMTKKGSLTHRKWGKSYCFLLLLFYISGQLIVFYNVSFRQLFTLSTYVLPTLVNIAGLVPIIIAYLAIRHPQQTPYQKPLVALLLVASIGLLAAPLFSYHRIHYVFLGIISLSLVMRDALSLGRKGMTYYQGLSQHVHYIIGSYAFAVAFQAITAPGIPVVKWWLTGIAWLPILYLFLAKPASHFSLSRSIPALLALFLACSYFINWYAQYLHFKLRWCPFLSTDPAACKNVGNIFETILAYWQTIL